MYVCVVCVCVMPSGTERFHLNVTPAATEEEANTQGMVCVCVCEKSIAAVAPTDKRCGGEWHSLRERERETRYKYSQTNNLL